MRQRWSHSKLTKLVMCGESFRREEEEREFAPPTSSMVRGTSVHAVAADAHMRQMIARRNDPTAPKSMVLRSSLPSEDEAGDLAATRFELERRTSGIVAVDPGASAAAAIGKDKDTAVRMSRHYVTNAAPYLDPIAVEHKVIVEPRDSDIAISGVDDLVTVDEFGQTVLWDLKTGERKPNANAARESSQLSMYALLWKLETGKLPDKVALNHLISDKSLLRPIYRVTQESTRTQADLDVMVARLNNAIDAVKRGVFIANGPGNWYCSQRWCRWFTTCKYVAPLREP